MLLQVVETSWCITHQLIQSMQMSREMQTEVVCGVRHIALDICRVVLYNIIV